MVHQMALYQEYFPSIREGKKLVEVRLFDEKRRKIHVGDTIEFVSVTDNNEVLKVVVTRLQVFATFQKMYESIPFNQFNCEGWTMEEMLEGTYEIYSSEQENIWGTLAISVKYIETLKLNNL